MEENADAGKSFVVLDMDQERTLRWDFRNMQKFEERAKGILKRHDAWQVGRPLHTGYILANFGKIADIIEAALAAAAGISGMEGKKGEPSEAAVAIQAYLDKGGSLETLQRELYRSYLITNDPSSIGAWLESVEREKDSRQVEQAKAEAKLEIAQLELAESQKKIENLKKLSGNTQAASPT
jgi:hypothetical protein